MEKKLIHSCPELIDYINEIGFLPLLPMGITGWSADEIVDEDCLCRKAVAHTANFSKARLHLSVVNGGLIFAITEGVFIHILRKEA